MMWIQHSLRVAWINRLAKEAFSASIMHKSRAKNKAHTKRFMIAILYTLRLENVHP